MEKTIKKDVVKMATGAIAGVTAFELATLDCMVFTVCIIVAIMIAAFVAVSKLNGETFTKRGKIAIVLVIFALIGIGTYHKYFCHQEEVQPEVNVQQEETVEESEESEEPAEESVEQEAEASVARPARGYCPEDEKLEVTEENSKTPAKAETTVDDTTATIKVEDNSKELADTEKAVEEAKENGDKVQTGLGQNNANKDETNKDTTITTVTKTEEPEKQKDDTQVEIDSDSAEDLKNEGEESSTNIETEDDLNDVIASDDEDLEEMLDKTTEETTEVVTTPANGDVSVEEVTEVENNEITDVEVEEPITNEVAKVEVNAVDGYEGYINSTMQFKINGDDVVLEGLDGIDYAFSNGILSINTGDCATVLTITASNSVSSQTFDVVINGIVG